MTHKCFVSWRIALATVGLSLAIGLVRLAAADASAGSIDWARVRELFQKQNQGQTLSDDERAYLQQAKEAYARGERPDGSKALPSGAKPSRNGDIDWERVRKLMEQQRNGVTLTEDEQKYLDHAKQATGSGNRTGDEKKQAQHVTAAGQRAGDIDWNRARELFRKKQSGQALTTEEQAYIDRVKAAYDAGARPPAANGQPATKPAEAPPSADGIDFDKARQLLDKEHNGQTLTPEERAYLDRAKEAYQRGRPNGQTGQPNPQGQRPGNLPAPPPPSDHTGLVPLTEMTAKDNYKGEDGGLYGGGENVPPAKQQQAADVELAKIVPLGPDGKPAADGKIVLISIGMSNTTMEFSRFKELADRDPAKSAQVVIVDCAQGGQDGARWSDASLPAWQNAESRLRAAGVTPLQVQAVWLKQARMGPASHGEYPKHAEELKGHILKSLNIAKQRFPNLRVVYLSSRIYAGYATTSLNPEPYAYESAFVVRSLIRDQIGGAEALNYNGSAGEVKAPLLLWGPYLWADGVTPRKSDGLVWNREDLAPQDGTHPSGPSGREKVAKLLLGFFTTDRNAKGWFCARGSKQ